jgi:hypothetical protein
MNRTQSDFISDVLRKLNPAFCLETGTSTGRGSATILCKSNPIKHVSVDLSLDGAEGCHSDRGWIDRMVKSFDNFTHFEGDSRKILTVDFITTQFPTGVDFFFCDGGHTYDVCYSDMSGVWPHINDNGVMIVDDYMSGPPDGYSIPAVTSAVDDFAGTIGIEIERWSSNGKGCAVFYKHKIT